MSAPRKTSRSDIVGGVRISHPDRTIYNDSGISKLDVALYYYSVGRWMVPHVAGRPVAMQRCASDFLSDVDVRNAGE
jgi:bifunctional non-homologous end joining protein LigD